MKAKRSGREPEVEQFQAYGEYTYDYLHQRGEREEAAADGSSTTPSAAPSVASSASPSPSPSAPLSAPSPSAAPSAAPLAAPARPPRPRRRGRAWLILLVALTMATIAMIVVMETVFRIEAVYVIGNERRTPQEIVALSGLTRGESIFAIREEAVEKALNADNAVIYKGMKKAYPSTIYLYVEEREAVAVMQLRGMQYLLDEEGLVMAEENTMTLPADMPVVIGLRASNVNAGQRLMVSKEGQLEGYQAIMEELRLQDYAAQIAQINLADPDRIYLVTREGVTAQMGDGKYMRAKVGALRTYMAYLRQLGMRSGTLDLSVPEDAKYIPES